MRSAISSPVGPGDVSVEDGDVVGVDAQQLQRGVAVAGDVGRDRFQAEAVADGFRHVAARPRRSIRACSDATSGRISPAYRKPDTCRQHHAPLRLEAWSTASQHERLPAGSGFAGRASPACWSSSRRSAAARLPAAGVLVLDRSVTVDVGRTEQRVARGGALPSTVWPAQGQAAVQIGQSQVQAGPNQHAAAIASVAKVMTAYLVLRDHPLAAGRGRADDHAHRRRCRRHRSPAPATGVGRADRRRRAADRTAGAAGAAAAVGEQHRRRPRALGCRLGRSGSSRR